MHTSVTHYNNDYASLTQSRKCHGVEEEDVFLSVWWTHQGQAVWTLWLRTGVFGQVFQN